MKLFVPHKPITVVRVNIVKSKFKTENINLCECTLEDARSFVQELINDQELSPFQSGRVTSINFRESVGSKNGRAISISFKGMTPEEVKALILRNLK